jgi:hypothetical protein
MSTDRKPPQKSDDSDLIKLVTKHDQLNGLPELEDDAEGIHEQLESVYQSAIDHLRMQMFALKRYLRSKDVPPEASRELDNFVMDVQDRWGVAVEAIEGMLGEE